MKKVSLFLVPAQIWKQSPSILSFFPPHIHSAATFCLKATLSQEHSLRPLLSDEKRTEGERDRERQREKV